MNAVHITSLRPVGYLVDCHHRLQAIMVSYCCLSYGIMLLSRAFFSSLCAQDHCLLAQGAFSAPVTISAL